MSSYHDPRRRSSMELDPPTMASSLKCRKNEFIELYNRDFTELQQCISRLSNIITTYSDNSRAADKGTKDGTGAAIAGAVIVGLGGLLAPFILGVSAAVAVAGIVVAAGGGIGKEVWSSKKNNLETKYIKDLRAELNKFQNKLIPMSNQMKALHQCVEEILKDVKSPEQRVAYLEKHFVSAAELVHFIRIYDAGGLAEHIAETVRLTGTITGMLINASTDEQIKELYDKCVTVMNTIKTTKNSLGQ